MTGIGACNHVYSSAFLKQLLNVPNSAKASAPPAPTQRIVHGQMKPGRWITSSRLKERTRRPSVPLLFSLAIDDPLEEASRELRPEEHLFACLDDVDVPNRTRTMCEARWQIFIHCAGPRCNHIVRTLPPSQSAENAQRHDEGMKRTMDNLLGGLPGGGTQHCFFANACRRSGHQKRTENGTSSALGFMGRRSAHDGREIAHKSRQMADEEPKGCLGELRNAVGVLAKHGFVGRPNWNSTGSPSQGTHTWRTGEWSHGWQHASSSPDCKKNIVLNQLCAAEQAHLRSHSEPEASDVLCWMPFETGVSN